MKISTGYAAMFLCCLCLSACGQNKPVSGQEKEEQITVDWKKNGFAVSEDVQEEQELWALEYIKWQHEEAHNGISGESGYIREAGAYNSEIYRLYEFPSQEKDEENRYLMEIYDTSTMQNAVTELDREKLDIGNGRITGMEVLERNQYVFHILEYEQEADRKPEEWRLSRNCLIYSDAEYNVHKTDVLSVFREQGIEDVVYNYECICDNSGNSYFRAGTDECPFQDIYILDREGRLLVEHKGDANDNIMEPLRMKQGELIFPIYNAREKVTRLVWFDTEKQQECTLARFENDSMRRVYGIQGNDIYYESYNGIVKWNIEKGDRKRIYRFDENGVFGVYNTMMIFCEGKAPILRMYGNEEDWLVILSEQEVEKPAATRITSMNGKSYNVQNCIAAASRRNPNLNFTYETCKEADANDFRNRIIAEMVAGGGPDILYVSPEDMRILQSKNLLMDLSTLLSEETVEKVLPGVLELGTVEGSFVGLAPEIKVYSVITLKDIWNQKTWSLEDVLGLMDTGRFSGIFCQGTTSFAPRALLAFLTEYGLRNSSLIDWETGESHFESELFLRILETAKTYGDNPIRTDTWLGEGGCIGEMQGADFEEFCSLYEKYGDNFYFVGAPTDRNSGNYLMTEGVLVVNRNAADLEAVSVILEYLLTDEIQYAHRSDSKLPIRRIDLDEVKTLELEGEVRSFWRDHPLKPGNDGIQLLNCYKDFLEKCIPYPERYDKLTAIVWEEGQSYISGYKSAEDVAQIIDRRIQVYLDENTMP
ncbi:MAG: hypothetical protein ACI4HQ_09120 [Acetatifactor sp.]